MSQCDPAYLVGINLAGRRVVVIGAGSTAQRRLPRLLDAGADVHVIAPLTTPAIDGMAVAGEITLERREYHDGDLDGAWYAMAVTGDALVNARVAAEATSRRIFCVRSENSYDCSAVTPATVEHDGITVGVLSGGDHQRSAAVRSAIAEHLVAGELDAGEAGDLAGTVAIVGGGPGDPDLITVRGRALLARADVVVADRLAPRELLDHLRPTATVIDASKIPYGRSMGQDAINAALVTHARAGAFVVRYKGGDPFLFGRGHEEVRACTDAGIPVLVVPGVTSAFSVPAAVGIPVTHRGLAQEVVVASGHVAPGADTTVDWEAIGSLAGSVVVLMGVKNSRAIADALMAGGRDAATPAAVIQEGMSRTQRTVVSTLGGLADAIRDEGIRPPAVIVVGPVVDLAGHRA